MAFSGEFITHGGFEIVRDAWLFVSNMMHSSAYQTCIMLFFLGSFVLAAFAGTFRGFMRAGLGDPSWLIMMFVVLAIYAGFFGVGIGQHWRLTGQLAIYDDVKNKNEVIGDLPPGLVALVSSINGIQVKLEELVEQAITNPAFGNLSEAVMGVKMLRDASYGQLYNTAYVMVPGEVKDSIWKFYVDVLSTVLTANPSLRQEVEGHSSSLLESMGKGAHPALFTTTWLDSSGNIMDHTEVVSGDEAWRRIKNFFTKSTVWQEIVSKYCSYFYFDTANPQSVTACKNIFKDAIGYFLGLPGKSSKSMAQDVILGALWRKYIAQLTGEDHPFRGAGAFSGANPPSITTSTGIVLEQWLPTAKVVVTVFVIGLTPIIMLFFITTFSFRAVTVLFGLYLWLLLWAVADKVAEGFWVNYAYSVMQTLDFSKGGAGSSITGLDLMGINASQVLAVLGGMRGVGMTLAGVLSYGILGFGGHVFARFMGSIEANLAEAKSLSGQKIMAESIHPSSTAQASLWESHVKQVGMAIPMEAVSSVAYYMSGYKKVFDTYSGGAYKGISPMQAKHMVEGDIASKTARANVLGMAKEAWGVSPTQASMIMEQKMALGSVAPSSMGNILSNAFGKDFVSGLGASELGAIGSNLHVKNATPGRYAELEGSITRKGLLAMAERYEALGRRDLAQHLRMIAKDMKEGETAAFSIRGTIQGGSLLTVKHGDQVFRYNYYTGQAGEEYDITKPTEIIPGLIATAGHVVRRGNRIELSKATFASESRERLAGLLDERNAHETADAIRRSEGPLEVPNAVFIGNDDGSYRVLRLKGTSKDIEYEDKDYAHRAVKSHEEGLVDLRVGDRPILFVSGKKDVLDGGYTIFDGKFNRSQLKSLQLGLKSLGPEYSNAVKGIEDLLLTGKESFKVHLETDGQGRVLELKVLDQALVDKRDEYNKIKGIKELDQYISKLDYGNETTWKTMRSFALANPQDEIVDMITDRIRRFGDMELQEEAQRFATGFGNFLRQEGRVLDVTEATAGGQAGIPFLNLLRKIFGGAALQGKTQFTQRVTKEMQSNLIYYFARKAQMDAFRVAGELATPGSEKYWEIFKQEYHKNLSRVYKGLQAYAENKDPSEFEVRTYMKESVNELKELFEKTTPPPTNAITLAMALDKVVKEIKHRWTAPEIKRAISAASKDAVERSDLVERGFYGQDK